MEVLSPFRQTYASTTAPASSTGKASAGPRLIPGTALHPGDTYPDYRQTIYWHPLLEIGAGETMTIPCNLPDYRGSFVVVAEGLDAAGNPVSGSLSFEVK